MGKRNEAVPAALGAQPDKACGTPAVMVCTCATDGPRTWAGRVGGSGLPEDVPCRGPRCFDCRNVRCNCLAPHV